MVSGEAIGWNEPERNILTKLKLMSGTAVVQCLFWSAPAMAQNQAALESEIEELRGEVETLRAEIRAMRAEMSDGAGAPPQSATGQSAAALSTAAPSAARVLFPGASAAARPAPDEVRIAWKGMPEFSTESGWSFKPRGRVQVDAGYLDAPASRNTGQADGRGLTTRLRRVYLGAQGKIPGGFEYRAEFNLAGDKVSATDVYLRYGDGPLSVTIGQHHPFTSMEQLTSDLFTTFTERASFINAFGYERRVGISAGYSAGDIMADAGVFTDDISALGSDGNKSWSVDGRLVWMPKFGTTQLHLGGSAHYRELGSFQATLGTQYRNRPYIGTSDIRYLDTGVLTVNRESGLGIEFAARRKRFHFASEAGWLTLDRPGILDPTFSGGYAEAGLFLTDDTRGYKNGTFDRVKPSSPLSKGGLGALELNARYDYVDLNDKDIGGGRQNAFGVSLIWTPEAYLRFMADYMHLIYDIPSARPRFDAEATAVRAQIDF